MVVSRLESDLPDRESLVFVLFAAGMAIHWTIKKEELKGK
jgi:hypothetical protein